MKKRNFLKTSALASMGLIFTPVSQIFGKTQPLDAYTLGLKKADEFVLPPLDYAFDALEPHIDKMTMEIHHGKHHAAYITNLNNAIKETEMGKMTLEKILDIVKEKESPIRNNAGGHYNHSLFWKILTPVSTNKMPQPTGELLKAIESRFTSLDKMKEQFNDASKTRFGSGWAWLSVNSKKELFISSTANQDNPLMIQIVKETGTPILGLDVWEHAYYLKYQNKRADYIAAFWNLINWEEVGKRYLAAK